jgi:hypothetical protein
MTSSKHLSPFTTKLVGFVALALASFGGTGIASAPSVGSERGVVEARGPVAVPAVPQHLYGFGRKLLFLSVRASNDAGGQVDVDVPAQAANLLLR